MANDAGARAEAPVTQRNCVFCWRRVVFLALALAAGAPGQAPPAAGSAKPPSSPPRAGDQVAASLEKQRASILRQAQSLMALGEGKLGDRLYLPWPAAAPPPPPGSQIAPFASPVSWPQQTFATDCPPLAPGELQRLTNQAGAREGLAPDLLRAVIDQESAGKPCVVSPAGAQGLMQLMPATQRYFGVADPFDPEESVLAGAKLLGTLMARYAGNLPKALAAYNAGPGAVDRAGGVPPIPQTQSYVNEIMRRVTPVAPLTVR